MFLCVRRAVSPHFSPGVRYIGARRSRKATRQETQWTTIFWEGWTALALCAAAVFWPGSAALGYPAVLWPGLALAAAVPVLWAGWWLWAEKAPPLTEEELMGRQGKVHIVTEEVFL